MIEIDVEKIMGEIREEIKNKYKEEPCVSFESIPLGKACEEVFSHSEFNENLHFMNSEWQNPYYFEIGGGLKGFIKRVIRKLGVFLGVPITERQTSFNAHTVRTMNEINRYILEQEKEKKALLERIEELEEKVAELKKN